MSLNPLSITFPLTTTSAYTSTPHLSRAALGNKAPPPKEDLLQTLFPPLFTKVMTYLSPYKICALTSVSPFLYNSFDESRWRPLCQQFFPESYEKHAERLKSSPEYLKNFPLYSRYFFMRQFNLMSGCRNLNAQQKIDFLFKATLSEDLVLLENNTDRSLMLWNIKEGKTINRWVKSDPIQKLFYPEVAGDSAIVQDGRAVILDGRLICRSMKTGTLIAHDLIGKDKVITLPCKRVPKKVVTFDKSQIIYSIRGTENIEGKPVDKLIWSIWNVFKGTTNILLLDPLRVEDVHVLDDNQIITSSCKTLENNAPELAVWHVSSQQTIKTCTETSRIDIKLVMNKRWVVYSTEDDNNVKVWDTLNNKKSNFPIYPKPYAFVALNERLVIYRGGDDFLRETLRIIDIFEGQQRAIPNSRAHTQFIPLNNEFATSSGLDGLTIWDDSTYKEEQLKRTHSSSSSSSSDTSSSSSSSSSTSSLRLPD